MPVEHYENFPVASLLIPKAQRRAVEVIYAFARSADDLADEGEVAPAARLAALDAYLAELDRIERGAAPESALFRELAEIAVAHRLPLQPCRDLISAFQQDVRVSRYACYADLLDYCRRSANPVGRLMLHLFECATPVNLSRSDAICTALQLINFWQDVAIDWRKDRVYLPQDELARFRVDEAQLAAQRWNANFGALIDFQIERTRRLMLSGSGLAKDLPGRFGWEIRLTVQGGLRILDKLSRARGDVFNRRPVLGTTDWLGLAWRAAFHQPPSIDPANP